MKFKLIKQRAGAGNIGRIVFLGAHKDMEPIDIEFGAEFPAEESSPEGIIALVDTLIKTLYDLDSTDGVPWQTLEIERLSMEQVLFMNYSQMKEGQQKLFKIGRMKGDNIFALMFEATPLTEE